MITSVQLSNRSSVLDFLDGLRRPCGHLLNAFQQMGIEEDQDIDTLCLMSNQHLDQVKGYLVENGMSQFLWVVIREGLKQRAERLSSQST